jgi:uncharacterized protein (TIGR00295 family)
MNSLPTPEECINLLRKIGCSEEVICHCKAVRDIALKIADYTDSDKALVETGALLHDIGRSKTHGIYHAVEGVKIAKKLGLSQNIINIIERHIGAGLSADVAKSLGLPKKDYIPITLEEKIVCHADNLVDNCRFQKIGVEVERALKEGHKDYALRLVELHKELSDICGIDLDNLL